MGEISDGDINDLMDQAIIERRTTVMFLRNAGATWSEVAAKVGFSIATVRKDYKIVARDINNEQPADVVARHRAVIFDIQRANYSAMMKGDKDAAVVILRALHRESKLLGLDAPTRVMATVGAEDFANEAAKLIEHINSLDQDTLKELTYGRRTDDAEKSLHVLDVEEVPITAPEPVAQPRRSPFDRRGSEQSGPVATPFARKDGEAAPADTGHDPAAPDAPRGTPDAADEGLSGQARHTELPEDDDGWSNL